MLVLQTSLSPNTDSNSNPNLLMGRISTINQKKKEKREQFAAGRVINLIIDLTQANRLVLWGQSNTLTAHGQAGAMRQPI